MFSPKGTSSLVKEQSTYIFFRDILEKITGVSMELFSQLFNYYLFKSQQELLAMDWERFWHFLLVLK